MTINKKTELVLERHFDPRSCRHTINGKVFVLHCHHYMSLYSQLAIDCGLLDGKKLLAEVAEDTFYEILCDYYRAHELTGIEDRISIAEQYYAVMGMGKMRVIYLGSDSAEVELAHSHADQGWLKKWGKADFPVNYFTCGYVAALLSAVLGSPPRAFSVSESASLVTGADRTKFTAVAL
jgi:hypothetical protein